MEQFLELDKWRHWTIQDGTEKWEELHKPIYKNELGQPLFTASSIPKLLGLSYGGDKTKPKTIQKKFIEEKKGEREIKETNQFVKNYGKQKEGYVRLLIQKVIPNVISIVCCGLVYSRENQNIAANPDGIIWIQKNEKKRLAIPLEIKVYTPQKKVSTPKKIEEIEFSHYVQVQIQLYCTESKLGCLFIWKSDEDYNWFFIRRDDIFLNWIIQYIHRVTEYIQFPDLFNEFPSLPNMNEVESSIKKSIKENVRSHEFFSKMIVK